MTTSVNSCSHNTRRNRSNLYSPKISAFFTYFPFPIELVRVPPCRRPQLVSTGEQSRRAAESSRSWFGESTFRQPAAYGHCGDVGSGPAAWTEGLVHRDPDPPNTSAGGALCFHDPLVTDVRGTPPQQPGHRREEHRSKSTEQAQQQRRDIYL